MRKNLNAVFAYDRSMEHLVAYQNLKHLKTLATELASGLKPGDVIGLSGDMGAGKTTLIQAIAEALGVQEPVQSPTFSMIHRYSTAVFPLVHVDCYRHDRLDTIEAELLDILEGRMAITFIEWIELWPMGQPYETCHVRIRTNGDDKTRVISLHPVAL
jgi:tRNA threonylcarbamoyladenosine biosynthesis protein TsaE